MNMGKDKMIRNLLNIYNVKYSIMIYDLVTYSPMETVIQFLCFKLGLSKTIVLLIVSFVIVL